MDDNFWRKPVLCNQIMYGTIGDENPNRPGLYRFSSSLGHVIENAQVLSPDYDVGGFGQLSKPQPGSPCIGVLSEDGGECFVVGFQRPHGFSEEDEEGVPTVGTVEENQSPGDKVFKTSGGGSIIIKRGGAVVIEGGVGTSIIMNPINNHVTIRSSNLAQIADGYRSSHGRLSPGDINPRTLHQETLHDRSDASGVSVAVKSGHVRDKVKRSIEVFDGKTKVLREEYESDGTWVGEGRKYHFGGRDADEPAVLGQQLVEVIESLIDAIASLKVNTAWGPSTTPLPDTQVKLTQIKNELSDKILSTFLFLSKDPSTIE